MLQDIDKTCRDINRYKVNIAAGLKMKEKLSKGIEEIQKEKQKLVEEKENMVNVFKEIEQKAFSVQESYKKTQEVTMGYQLSLSFLSYSLAYLDFCAAYR